jgi:hypothetical protein
MPLHDKPNVRSIARPTLGDIDSGRARRGLSVIGACAVFWTALIWLALKYL